MNSRTKKWLVLGSIVWLFAIGSAISTFMLVSSSSIPVAKSIAQPVQLIGTWTGETGGISATADITEGNIQIDLSTSNGMSGVYWIGTFDTANHMTTSFKVTSKGDTKTMASDLLASQDATKVFTYKDGDLSYMFSMVGVTTTVHLHRSSQ